MGNKIARFYIGSCCFFVPYDDKEKAVQQIKEIVETHIGKSLVSRGESLDPTELITQSLDKIIYGTSNPTLH